jgi:hypothetical protein
VHVSFPLPDDGVPEFAFLNARKIVTPPNRGEVISDVDLDAIENAMQPHDEATGSGGGMGPSSSGSAPAASGGIVASPILQQVVACSIVRVISS